MTKKMRQTFQEWHLAVRLVVYFVGLFIMTLGVSMSVKSNLGVSPVSSIPYTITCIFGLEMGKATIVFHIFLVILQIIILRKEFKLKNLLQVLVVISLISCLSVLHKLGSVGIGTVIAAILVGVNLGFITKLFGDKRDRLLHRDIGLHLD